MIQLNTDFTLLNKFFGISPNKIHKYANMGFEEIMKAEAEEGNLKAKNYKEILADPDKLLDIFKLASVENKLIILQNMSEYDLDKLLPYLNNEQLSRGLQFFNDDKLIQMCEDLPVEELSQMVLEKFRVIDILSLLEENSMNVFIQQPDVERRYAQNYFESLNTEILENIMVQSFGAEYKDKSREEYLQEMKQMQDDDYTRFLISIERKQKIEMINNIVEQDNDLINLFKSDDLVKPMELLMKEDKIKMMKNLEQEFLIPMIQELPMDLTQIVLTQIDPKDFSEILAKDFQDILGEVVLFSTKGT